MYNHPDYPSNQSECISVFAQYTFRPTQQNNQQEFYYSGTSNPFANNGQPTQPGLETRRNMPNQNQQPMQTQPNNNPWATPSNGNYVYPQNQPVANPYQNQPTTQMPNIGGLNQMVETRRNMPNQNQQPMQTQPNNNPWATPSNGNYVYPQNQPVANPYQNQSMMNPNGYYNNSYYGPDSFASSATTLSDKNPGGFWHNNTQPYNVVPPPVPTGDWCNSGNYTIYPDQMTNQNTEPMFNISWTERALINFNSK